MYGIHGQRRLLEREIRGLDGYEGAQALSVSAMRRTPSFSSTSSAS